MVRNIKKDDSGTNVLLEYVILFGIAAVLFTVLLLTLQNVMTRSDTIILTEEFDNIASHVANRITDFSNDLKVNDFNNDYVESDIGAGRVTYFDLPKPVHGKQYVIEVKYDNTNPGLQRGVVKVYYAANPSIYSTATFRVPYPASNPLKDNILIYGSSYRLKLYYDGNKIGLEEAL